ncbi:hypothetical protein GCM10007881_04120 [Mesorhizobium huakuii]|uniref:hypothetical protein n=2 Tax=Pseudomonadota TaxID=1224 RepID=UPI00235DB93B|nr:hypothetical protein [Mesorhizobium huakuii]GLQ76896.1 hypothetical protein GCM10007881_04120 [Mesorhizobium huakuii]
MKKTGLQIIKLAVSATVAVASIGIGVGLSALLTGSDLRQHQLHPVIRVSRADARIWEVAQPDKPYEPPPSSSARLLLMARLLPSWVRIQCETNTGKENCSSRGLVIPPNKASRIREWL